MNFKLEFLNYFLSLFTKRKILHQVIWAFVVLQLLASFSFTYAFDTQNSFDANVFSIIKQRNKALFEMKMIWHYPDLSYICKNTTADSLKKTCNDEYLFDVFTDGFNSLRLFGEIADQNNINTHKLELVKVEEVVGFKDGLLMGEIIIHAKHSKKNLIIKLNGAVKTDRGWRIRTIEWVKVK